MRKTLTTIAAALAMSLLVSTASAGPATDTVKSKQSQLFKVVAKPKTSARQAQLKKLFDEMLDYDAFATGSMGKKWDTLTPEQQKEFSGLLTRLVRANYRRNLKKMLDYNIVYAGEGTKKGGTLVKTRAKHKTKRDEPEIEVDFVMAKRDGKMRVVDIYTERASLVRTYRSQFLRILRKKSYDHLIAKLKKKLKKME